MTLKYRTLLLGSAITLALGGCADTAYVRPPLPLPEQFSSSQSDVQVNIQPDWWTAFMDPDLNRLVQTVLVANPDIELAAIRVQRQALAVRGAQVETLPKLSGNIGASRPLDGPAAGTTHFSSSYSASFEVDLWGRLAKGTAIARKGAEIAASDHEAAKLAIIGLALDHYWTIGLLHQQIEQAKQDLQTSEALRDFVDKRFSAGAISGLEQAQAQNDADQVRVRLSGLEQRLVEERAQLTLLLDGTPWPEESEATELNTNELAAIPAGVPADLIWRRPDLVAAEATLQQSLLQKDAVRAGFYPGLSLTASGGASSKSLLNILSNPLSNIAAALSLPFLNFLQNDVASKDASLAYDAAVIEFRKKVVEALAEVNNALSARQSLIDQERYARSAVGHAARAEQLYAEQYRAGAVTLRDLLEAQRQLRSLRIELQSKSLERLKNQSLIYRVLGGGVSLPPPST